MMDFDFSGDLHKIKSSVLIVCGKKDSANKRASIKMRQKIPCAKIKRMELSGHEVNVDAQEKLGKLLDGFWKKVNNMKGISAIEVKGKHIQKPLETWYT